MIKKFFKKLLIAFCCLLFLASFVATEKVVLASEPTTTKIISIKNNPVWEGGVHVAGKSFANATILISIKDERDLFSYSTKTLSDSQGNWAIRLSQPLRTGSYYVEVIAQNGNKVLGSPIKSELIKIIGPFGVIVPACSMLIILLLAGFVSIWYASKLAEMKRYRRILASERDIESCYNTLKKDVDDALSKFDDGKVDSAERNEIKFFLRRMKENIEKINKYVLQGVSVIGKYDIISKIDNALKFNKNKNIKT